MARTPVANVIASFIGFLFLPSPRRGEGRERGFGLGANSQRLSPLTPTLSPPGRGSLIHYLVLADAPQVRRADIALAVADLDAAPAARALADPADDAVLDLVTNLRAFRRIHPDRPRIAGPNDRRAA